MPAPRVFISFTQEDEEVARNLYAALIEAGADVFQFQQSSRPGEVAWKEVHASIEQADWFVVLLSAASLESNAVKDEIEHAYYSRVNQEKPSLVPAMLEKVQKPSELARFSNLDFHDFDAGLDKLLDTIGLTRPSHASATGAVQHEKSRIVEKTLPWLGKSFAVVVVVGIILSVAYTFWPRSETSTAEMASPISEPEDALAVPTYRVTLETIRILDDGDEDGFANYFWELKLNGQVVADQPRAGAPEKELGDKYELTGASLLVQDDDAVTLTGYVADRDFDEGFSGRFNPDTYVCFDEALQTGVVEEGAFTGSVRASGGRNGSCEGDESRDKSEIDIVYTVEREAVD